MFYKFQESSWSVELYIILGSGNPILDGNKAEQLKIIFLNKDDNHIFNPVLLILSQEKDGEVINNISSILKHYPQNFNGLAKLRNWSKFILKIQ